MNAVSWIVIGSCLVGCGVAAETAPANSQPAREDSAGSSVGATDSNELLQLFTADQADRRTADGHAIDWSVVGPRDHDRQARVKELYSTGQLHTGADYYHAAMVLQHGNAPEDFLLAHELCVVALVKGEARARWLAAATEDRFLMNLGRPQRFGTQFRGQGDGLMRLYETDPGVTDDLRQEMHVPPLAKAKANEAKMNGGIVPPPPPVVAADSTAPVFEATDDADAAFTKLKQANPHTPAGRAHVFLACRDYCARFPDSPHYGEALVRAVDLWRILSPNELGLVEIKSWDPATAEHDPKLNAEQQATIAFRIAEARAGRQRTPGVSTNEARFMAFAAIAAPYRATRAAHSNLSLAAVWTPPAKALPVLRELYADDPEMQPCIKLLENFGQQRDFEFTALDGRHVDSRDYRGKVVLLHVWAKSTDYAMGTLPQLKRLVEQKGAENIALVGLNLDETREIAEEVVRDQQLTWPQLYDGQHFKGVVARQFLIQTIPAYVLFDRRGALRAIGLTPFSPEAQKMIDALLAENPPEPKT